MIQPINIYTNQFELLLLQPFSWKVLVQKSWSLSKGDKIKYVEIDSNELPTGRELVGLINCVSDGEEYINEGKSTWAYCQDISVSIGGARVGENLIVT